MNYKICSIVVTFNRKSLLSLNIDSLLMQSYKTDILIIDNASTDGTEEYIKSRYDFKENSITYYNTEKNIGGSGGFYTGLKLASESNKYNYYWLMDDDGRPVNSDTLQKLVDYLPQAKDYDIVNSLVVQEDNESLTFGLANYHKRSQIKESIVFGYNNPFNGTLIPHKLVTKMGLPRKEFFIGYDEVEYMARCKRNGGELITLTDSLYFHPLPKMPTYKLFGRTVAVYDGGWKQYYRLRNTICFEKEYFGKIRAIKTSICTVLYVLAFTKPNKLKVLKTIIHATVDGYKGDFSVNDFHITNKYKKNRS